jgi:hypothetical protein
MGGETNDTTRTAAKRGRYANAGVQAVAAKGPEGPSWRVNIVTRDTEPNLKML